MGAPPQQGGHFHGLQPPAGLFVGGGLFNFAGGFPGAGLGNGNATGGLMPAGGGFMQGAVRLDIAFEFSLLFH
jgi:hypothetical protein